MRFDDPSLLVLISTIFITQQYTKMFSLLLIFIADHRVIEINFSHIQNRSYMHSEYDELWYKHMLIITSILFQKIKYII